MNEIDLWNEAENCLDKNIGYNLFRLFEWSDNPTSEENFDYIYNKIWEGEPFSKIIKEVENESS